MACGDEEGVNVRHMFVRPAIQSSLHAFFSHLLMFNHRD